MGNLFSQSYFIREPALTEKNLLDLKEKVNQSHTPPGAKVTEHTPPAQVFIVTGGNSGCGFEPAKLLYRHNGTVDIAGRSPERCTTAIAKISAEFPASGGRLEFLMVDLGDLTTIKPAAEEFTRREQRLDVLWNNAGVMGAAQGKRDGTGMSRSSASSSAAKKADRRMRLIGSPRNRRATSCSSAPTASATSFSPSCSIPS